MTFEMFLKLFFAISTATGLVTEGLKKWLQSKNESYHANTLAGYTSVALSILTWIFYIIFTGATISVQLVAYLVGLIILSWLASMVGYDKVIQTITQIKGE